jgi:hypothetical protein
MYVHTSEDFCFSLYSKSAWPDAGSFVDTAVRIEDSIEQMLKRLVGFVVRRNICPRTFGTGRIVSDILCLK